MPLARSIAAYIKDLEAVCGRIGDLSGSGEEDAIGQDVYLFGGNATVNIGLAGVGRGGNGDGVGCLVDGLFAGEVAGVIEGVFLRRPSEDAPAR